MRTVWPANGPTIVPKSRGVLLVRVSGDAYGDYRGDLPITVEYQ